MKIILNDKTEVQIVDYTSNSFIILCPTQSDFLNMWAKMTEENLAEVRIIRDETIIQVLKGLKPDGVQAVKNPDGSYTGHFYFYGATYTSDEEEYATIGKILIGEE